MPTITASNLPNEAINDVILDMWGYNLTGYDLRPLTEGEWNDLAKALDADEFVETASAWIDPTPPSGDTDQIISVTYDQIRQAYQALLDLDQSYCSRCIHDYILDTWRNRDGQGEIDFGEIDSVVADVIMQVAAYGDVIYG